MKAYIATKFQNRLGFEIARALLELSGHEITHDWTQESDEGLEEPVRTLYRQHCAINDMMGVQEADVVILLPTEAKMAGAFVELGIALALNKRVLIVDGFREEVQPNIFYFLPQCYVEHYPTIAEAVAALSDDGVPGVDAGGLSACDVVGALAAEPAQS